MSVLPPFEDDEDEEENDKEGSESGGDGNYDCFGAFHVQSGGKVAANESNVVKSFIL